MPLLDLTPILGLVGATPTARQVGADHFPHQVLADLMVEHLVGHLDLADDFVVPVPDVDDHGPPLTPP